MDIKEYRIELECNDDVKLTLTYRGNENIIIARREGELEYASVLISRHVLSKFLEMIE